MTVFDLIVIIVLLASTGLAVVRGGILELATLIALGLAILLSIQLSGPFVSMLGREGSLIVTLFVYAGLIAGFFIVLYTITHILLARYRLSANGQRINRIAGGIFGFLRGYVIIGLGFLAYGYHLDEAHQHDSVRKAFTLPLAQSAAGIFERLIPAENTITDEQASSDLNKDAASEGYGRSDRAGLSEVITTVTTSQSDEDNSETNSSEGDTP